MFEISPSQAANIVMIIAAIVALIITFFIAKTFKIPNPNFALARASSTFFIIWLLWGNIKSEGDANMATENVGVFNYLTLTHTKSNDIWLMQFDWDLLAVLLTLGVNLIGVTLLSMVVTHLGEISDRRR